MNKDIEKIENRIKDILEKNEDAIKGFDKGAENAKELGTKAYFARRAENRKMFLKQLRNSVTELNVGNNEIEGSTAGAVHRTWMDVKAFFASDNDESMLEEAVRGDKSAIKEYNEVLTETMIPYRVKEIIREQRDSIQNDLETSEILEDFR
ncbi:ferritin-like domain-containing protein [Ulvibacterium marinum]|uniref:PA2169 family four-helix-bundle protein n=1 Tax=Ulvibacterium marinum TaxID=2419782 RepID=A0A3B0C329_9FLAO|nr:PA2169 family four-helix-bundle protein [Ulvibacterium marinum]RKN78689.1 PA2169 family four-helix-bundle protein [Ulvibacterium marinum]